MSAGKADEQRLKVDAGAGEYAVVSAVVYQNLDRLSVSDFILHGLDTGFLLGYKRLGGLLRPKNPADIPDFPVLLLQGDGGIDINRHAILSRLLQVHAAADFPIQSVNEIRAAGKHRFPGGGAIVQLGDGLHRLPVFGQRTAAVVDKRTAHNRILQAQSGEELRAVGAKGQDLLRPAGNFHLTTVIFQGEGIRAGLLFLVGDALLPGGIGFPLGGSGLAGAGRQQPRRGKAQQNQGQLLRIRHLQNLRFCKCKLKTVPIACSASLGKKAMESLPVSGWRETTLRTP